MLEAATRYSLLAFGTPGFAPDEHLSGTQPTSGVAMSQITQSDVKNHPPPRFHTKIHLCDPVSKTDAAPCSGAEPNAIKSDPAIFAQDFVPEHSSSVAAVASADPVTGTIRIHVTSPSKSAQA
jgi:hypothetical protein